MSLTIRKLVGEFGPASPVAAAPTLASIAPNHGNATGGVVVTLTGTGFQVGMRVAFVSGPHVFYGTVVIRASSISATCHTPALIPGVYQVYVVNPDGQGSNGVVYTAIRNSLKGTANIAFSQTGKLTQRRLISGNAAITFSQTGNLTNVTPPFALADLNPDFYFRGSYGGVPWLPTAPGDTHGNLTKLNSNAPAVGPVLNGFTPARMNFQNGLAQALKAATAHTQDIIDAAHFTILVFSRQFGLNTDDPNFRVEACLANDDNVQFGLTQSDGGIRAGIFDPSFGPRQTAHIQTSFGSTTIAAGSNGHVLPQANIDVASTAGADPIGSFCVNTGTGRVIIDYTGISGNTFTGCMGGAGQTLGTGQSVTACVWTMSVMRFNLAGTIIKCWVSQMSGTSEVTATSPVGPFITGGVPAFGQSMFSGEGIFGDIMEVATWKSLVVDADLVKCIGYFNNTYGTVLT